MRILVLVAALVTTSQASNDCLQGACYPPSGDLLLGRAQQLRASSTCGLAGSEAFCTPYQQRRMKCCPCDSRNPKDPLAHTVQEVLATSGPDRWWQSKKGVSPVTLQVDLNNLFHLHNLVLNFKGPRPSDFVIERSLDNGTTWKPALYLATDCQKVFPDIATALPIRLEEPHCVTLPPTAENPYQDQNVEFNPLRQYTYVSAPKSKKVEELSGLTGLRVRMTGLGDVPQLPGRSLSRFFAIKEMRMMGSCMCHGHANRCLPDMQNSAAQASLQVTPRCDCQHNTAGMNCERCDDLFNDLPWRPAEEGKTHSCQRCECNSHARRCRFDPAVYEASGRRSGGVCEGCMHHTTGPKCDRCAPGYQPNPRSKMDRPDACIRCVCSTEGTVNAGGCDDTTSSCQCKVNVEGPRCDRCKRGYYGLSAANPLGCSKCSCSSDGSISDVCDPVIGQCLCRPHFHGSNCDMCSNGYWKPFLSERCVPCNCDPTTSYSDTCDQVTGQCRCRPNFGGRTCNECPENTFGDPLLGCQKCQCDPEGTLPEGCNKQTGVCLCRPGVTGSRCGSCSRGHCDTFPTCKLCPSCFFTLDSQRQNLSLALNSITPHFPTTPDHSSVNFGPRILALEAQLKLIQESISFPPSTAQQVDDVLSQLEELRNQLKKINDGLSPPLRTPGLDSDLDKLWALLERLTVEYKAKKSAMDNTLSSNNAGAFSAIKQAYKESSEAAGKVNASETTLMESADIRENALDLLNQVQPANTRALYKLNHVMSSQPDLTPVAKQVCGSVRTEPCTPLQCEGKDLCPPEGTPPCKAAEKCVGALPLSKRADADVKNVKGKLERLAKKITDAAEKLQETQEITNQVRQSAAKLSNKMRETRDRLEDDLEETRGVVKDLKDFLSDPLSNLTHIQDVSDWILKAKLPLSPAALKKKLEELKNLAANLSDSSTVLNNAAPQLDEARKLLDEAQEARNQALGVKGDVDGLLSSFGMVEKSLSDIEDKVQNSTYLMDDLKKRLMQAKDQLSPAEKNLDDANTMMKPMTSQLRALKDLLENAQQKAQEARDSSEDAEREAAIGSNDLLTLEKQLDRLKAQVPPGGAGGSTGALADRVAELQKKAGLLANSTGSMFKALEGKGDSLRNLQAEILQKSRRLDGLEIILQVLLAQLRKKAHDLSICQG
ncbi:laminin subunit beta-3 isoform X1 [Takifugu rubripes]|uniref:laminin subunit beta-3 isoform X1 n=2 Tax=Takifugu rubripes TaxID=31033 RepID=UPI0005D239B4|nr:laminin subunit beta-3 isoform X1 [Takifugu rubripes]|eukprot:XP_011611933.1 PREDICTED: laminin subunit beta-3 [Takifugu rubripes]